MIKARRRDEIHRNLRLSMILYSPHLQEHFACSEFSPTSFSFFPTQIFQCHHKLRRFVNWLLFPSPLTQFRRQVAYNVKSFAFAVLVLLGLRERVGDSRAQSQEMTAQGANGIGSRLVQTWHGMAWPAFTIPPKK